MLFIECKKCGSKRELNSKNCSNCGVEGQKKLSKLSYIVIIFAVIFSSIESMGTKEEKKVNPDAWKQESHAFLAYSMMEDFVKNNLKSPSTAEFPGIFEKKSHITVLEEQTYKINSYVDSQNSFGAVIRTHFVGMVKQTSPNDWQLISLEFLE